MKRNNVGGTEMRVSRLLCLMMVMMVLIVATGNNARAERSDGMNLLKKVLYENRGQNVEMGNIMMLGGNVIFAIPLDWETLPPGEKDEDMEFQCVGKDEEGRKIVFCGMTTQGKNVSIEDARIKMDEQHRSHAVVLSNDINMLMTGDDENVAGFIISTDYKVLMFGFYGEDCGLEEILASDKLLDDIAAILDSVWAFDPEKLTKFEGEESEKEKRDDILLTLSRK